MSAIDRIKTHRWLARRVITVASVSSRRRSLAWDDHIAKIPASPGPLVCPVCARFSFDAAWNPFTTSHLNRTAAAAGRLTARFNSSPQYSAASCSWRNQIKKRMHQPPESLWSATNRKWDKIYSLIGSAPGMWTVVPPLLELDILHLVRCASAEIVMRSPRGFLPKKGFTVKWCLPFFVSLATEADCEQLGLFCALLTCGRFENRSYSCPA